MTGESQNFMPTAEPNCSMLCWRSLLKIIRGLKLIQGTVGLLAVLWEPILQKSCSKAICVQQIIVRSQELPQGHAAPISPVHIITPAVSWGPQALFPLQKRGDG